MDVSILDFVIGGLTCPECMEQSLSLKEQSEKKKGLASFLEINCTGCGHINDFYTSHRVSKESVKSDKMFDVNKRMICTMRAFGQSHAGIEKFTTLMGMPKPMTKNNYYKVVKKLVPVTETAQETMFDAADELSLTSSVPPGVTIDVANS